jgi:hypothetical protein
MTIADILAWLDARGIEPDVPCVHGDRFPVTVETSDGAVCTCYVCLLCAIDDRPPECEPTPEQSATIAWLEAAGQIAGVDVDAASTDGTAYDPCDNDSNHGPATVCTPDGYLCEACGCSWVQAQPAGTLVSPEVLRIPTTATGAAA